MGAGVRLSRGGAVQLEAVGFDFTLPTRLLPGRGGLEGLPRSACAGYPVWGRPEPVEGAGMTCRAGLAPLPVEAPVQVPEVTFQRRCSSHPSGKLIGRWPLPGDPGNGVQLLQLSPVRKWLESSSVFHPGCPGVRGRCHPSSHLVDCPWVLSRGQGTRHPVSKAP